MPKMLETYNPFGGGINSKDDARDIAKNELVDCVNIMVDSIGKVRPSPSVTIIEAEHQVDFDLEGRGLFTWNADASWDDDSYVGDAKVPTEYIVLHDSVNCQVDMYPGDENTPFLIKGAVNPHWIGLSSQNLDMGSNTVDDVGEVTFYAADNALRVFNANFLQNTGLIGMWFGFIDRDYFPYASGTFMLNDSNGNGTQSKWYLDGQRLPYPTKGIWNAHVIGVADASSTADYIYVTTTSLGNMGDKVSSQLNSNNYNLIDHEDQGVFTTDTGCNSNTIQLDGSANDEVWDGRSYSIHPPDGTGFNVDVEIISSTDSMWANGSYHIGQSFVYIGDQESRVVTIDGGSDATGTLTLAEDEYPKFQVTTTAGAISSTTGFNPRIIGGRIYTRRADRGAKWRLAVDMSFERGTRMSLNHGFDYWNSYGSAGSNVLTNGAAISNVYYIYTDQYSIKAPSPETFQTINGYDSQQPSTALGSTGWGAKASVVANQRTFLGNVKYKDETGSVATHSDRILFSPIGKYDVFPTNHFIDIGLGDGDDIVNIIETSDRLLVFKKKKLYIVNIGSGSDAGWFIEGEYAYKGIENKAAAFKTDMGCVWANVNGCYLFDGRQVTDLTEKLDDDKWTTFIEGGSTPATKTCVGYIPAKNQIVVAGTATGASNEVYIYDIRTRSWVRNTSIFEQASDKDITNFAIYKNNLIYCVQSNTSPISSTINRINTASTGQKIEFITKDEDFGQPSLKKKFYKVYVNYRLNGGSSKFLECRYSLNGSKAGAIVSEARNGGSKAYTLFSSTRQTLNSDNSWRIATFEASTPFTGQSISMYFATVSADDGSILTETNLEINEVTIEWRPLRARAVANPT